MPRTPEVHAITRFTGSSSARCHPAYRRPPRPLTSSPRQSPHRFHHHRLAASASSTTSTTTVADQMQATPRKNRGSRTGKIERKMALQSNSSPGIEGGVVIGWPKVSPTGWERQPATGMEVDRRDGGDWGSRSPLPSIRCLSVRNHSSAGNIERDRSRMDGKVTGTAAKGHM